MATVSVRYIVDNVDEAISFYCEHLGFTEQMHPAPTFAMLTRGDLRLVLSAPSSEGGGGRSMPDGTRPEPGGWNRIMVEVDDLDSSAGTLREAGAHFRSPIIEGVGGRPFREPGRALLTPARRGQAQELAAAWRDVS
jgi:catechol 2,3-dioxygenase-like lactoylglutathione lyase family enzyme